MSSCASARRRGVARRVAALLASGAPPSESSSSAASARRLRLVAIALEREQIAHSAVEDTTLAATPEAQDLIAVLDALVSPRHALSLARALRSPIFGASDADLLELSAAALAAGDRDWWRALAAMAAPSAGAGARAHAAAALARGRRRAAAARPARSHRPRRRGCASARSPPFLPSSARSRSMRSMPCSRRRCCSTAAATRRRTVSSARSKRRTVKSAPPVRADAVRLLTVHGAKGLEADTVFITDADPERPGTETTTLLIDWPVEAERPLRWPFSIPTPRRAARSRCATANCTSTGSFRVAVLARPCCPTPAKAIPNGGA